VQVNDIISQLVKQAVQGDALIVIHDHACWAAWVASVGTTLRRSVADAWNAHECQANAADLRSGLCDWSIHAASGNCFHRHSVTTSQELCTEDQQQHGLCDVAAAEQSASSCGCIALGNINGHRVLGVRSRAKRCSHERDGASDRSSYMAGASPLRPTIEHVERSSAQCSSPRGGLLSAAVGTQVQCNTRGKSGDKSAVNLSSDSCAPRGSTSQLRAPLWGLLSADVLSTIFKKLACADAVAATGVCRHWRRAAVQVCACPYLPFCKVARLLILQWTRAAHVSV
jgi:hypothetical protein